MAEGDFDFTLLGDLVVKPTTEESAEESADPVHLLTNKGIVLYFGAHWSERKFREFETKPQFLAFIVSRAELT